MKSIFYQTQSLTDPILKVKTEKRSIVRKDLKKIEVNSS